LTGEDAPRVKKIALATARAARGLDEDMAPLLRALQSLRIPAEAAEWDDPGVDWSSYALVLVRSTWDYAKRRDEFLAWADRVSALTTLANTSPILRWNTDKRYLRELSAGKAAVVPTHWIEPGDDVELPFENAFVVKPAVSAGAIDTARYERRERDSAALHVRRLQAAGRTVMVQPYLEQVDQKGETGMVYLAGEYSHAIRKSAILRPGMAYVDGLFARETIEPCVPSEIERAVAERVLSLVPGGAAELLYARVDLAPGPAGEPLLLELELTEPSLFFAFSQGGEDRLARALADRLGAGRGGRPA
jgi:hypothetical protein